MKFSPEKKMMHLNLDVDLVEWVKYQAENNGTNPSKFVNQILRERRLRLPDGDVTPSALSK